jgi:hypothetical protein
MARLRPTQRNWSRKRIPANRSLALNFSLTQ